jgi:hypothetical protein
MVSSFSGRSYTIERQMAIVREKVCMYNCQICVLWSVPSSSFHRNVKLLPEPWYTINFLCLLPLHVTSSTVLKKYNRQQKNHHPKKNHFTADKAIIFLYNSQNVCQGQL